MITLAQNMQQVPWQKLVLLFIVIGFSLLSWIFKQLQQQRELRRQEMNRQKLEQESLRTGPPAARTAARGPATFEEPAEEAETAAARRAAHLQELRRKRQEALRAGRPVGGPRATTSTSTGGVPAQGIDINLGGVILRIPGSTGPTVPGTRRPQPGQHGGGPRRPLTPEQAADLRRRQAQQRGFEAKRSAAAESARQAPRGAQADQRELARRDTQEQKRRADARRAEATRQSEEGVSGEDPVRRLVRSDPDAPPPPTKAALKQVLTSLRGPGLRQALILREVLGPPVSMR
ncbi:MAG: LapA family protein [Phycisphaerales bacterium]|nr:LapA family protein [Phycisphaerales bacterium]